MLGLRQPIDEYDATQQCKFRQPYEAKILFTSKQFRSADVKFSFVRCPIL